MIRRLCLVTGCLVLLVTGLFGPALALPPGALADPGSPVAPSPPSSPSPPSKPGPTAVTYGIYINTLENIDLASNSYSIDLYLWLRWKDSTIDPSTSIEVMNTLSGDGTVQVQRLFDEPVDMPDGSKYTAFRMHGSFNSKMDLARYPFDVQTLVVDLEDSKYDSTMIEYVPDTNPVTISAKVTLPGYIVGEPTASAVEHRYPTNFGDLRVPDQPSYSRISITLPVQRHVLPSMVKIVVPIFLVILITSLIFLLPGRFEDSRIGIGVTAMLTMVALQWSTTSDLPNVEYLMMIDLIYMLSTGYVLAAMAYSVFASRREIHDASEAALDRRVGIASLIVYGVLLTLTIVGYLTFNS